MKTLAFIFACGLLTVQACAQKLPENEVPAVVINTFKTKFIGAKSVKWEKEETQYEAEFESNKKEHSASFDATGKLLELETEIPLQTLPKAVHDAVAKAYPDGKITEAAQIEQEGVTLYEAEVTQEKHSFDLIFDAKGKLIEKVAKKEKDKD
jgi:hypothetical protein